MRLRVRDTEQSRNKVSNIGDSQLVIETKNGQHYIIMENTDGDLHVAPGIKHKTHVVEVIGLVDNQKAMRDDGVLLRISKQFRPMTKAEKAAHGKGGTNTIPTKRVLEYPTWADLAGEGKPPDLNDFVNNLNLAEFNQLAQIMEAKAKAVMGS
jgi:hypothetical protein